MAPINSSVNIPEDLSPEELRTLIRQGKYGGNTSGFCAGYVQCNLVILPADSATEFLQFCQRNPKPCPLIAKSEPGDFKLPTLGHDLDIRTDIPSYKVFEQGQVVSEINDISALWRDDLVAFLLGCSFSFEEALIADGLDVRNISEAVNVPMYRTNIDCTPAGPFAGKMVVSMRPFLPSDVETVIAITEQYPRVHGAPIHVGSPEEIGVDVSSPPDWGDAVEIRDGEVPVFWACGVTPQAALVQARLPLAITHAPGHMLILDVENEGLTGNLMEN